MNRHSNENEGVRVLEEFVCQAIPNSSVHPSKSLNVEVDWPGVNLPSVLDELFRALPEEHRARVVLSVEPAGPRLGSRAMDGAIIGGIIQGVDTVLCPFLTALLTRVQEHKGKCVVITLPDKTTYQLETDASPEQINQVASAVERAASARFKVTV